MNEFDNPFLKLLFSILPEEEKEKEEEEKKDLVKPMSLELNSDKKVDVDRLLGLKKDEEKPLAINRMDLIGLKAILRLLDTSITDLTKAVERNAKAISDMNELISSKTKQNKMFFGETK